jgi:hypothetical protein
LLARLNLESDLGRFLCTLDYWVHLATRTRAAAEWRRFVAPHLALVSAFRGAGSLLVFGRAVVLLGHQQTPEEIVQLLTLVSRTCRAVRLRPRRWKHRPSRSVSCP